MEFRRTASFARECKRLKKKYKSLDSDLAKLEKVLGRYPAGRPSRNWAVLKKNRRISIIKTRLSCASLRKRSLRVVYAYHHDIKVVEMICFLEIFAKSDKEREDQVNIKDYLKGFKK